MILTSCQIARVCYLTAGDWSNLGGLDRRHGGRVAGEGHELELQSLAVFVDVNNRPHVPRLQSVLWNRGGQDDSIVLFHHVVENLLGDLNGRRGRVRRGDSHPILRKAVQVKGSRVRPVAMHPGRSGT